MRLTKNIGRFVALGGIAGLIGCTAGSQGGGAGADLALPIYSAKPSNLRINLTDAPLRDAAHVYVDIDHIELLLEKNSVAARVRLAENFGVVDLLSLRNGVTLPMEDVDLPAGVEIKQIRLILKHEGHSVVKTNGDVCNMKTPSAQQTGVKIVVNSRPTVEDGFSYSMVVDFDAEHSVVEQGNGRCLLKPVLKMKSLTRVEHDDIDDDGNVIGNEPGEDLSGGIEDGNTGDGDGYDDMDPIALPPDISEDDILYYW